MVVSAAEQTGEVPSFADRLGERVVVSQPSGALLEFLYFHPALSSAAFFESAVKARLKRLSNFRQATYARSSRLQRDAAHGNRLALVSTYTPGRRLADVMALARRGRIRPTTPVALSLTRELMTGVALLHDYAPDVFHGALGPERLVIGADGRLVITEYVLGAAVEQAVPEWGSPRLWRDYRLATLGDPTLARFGRRVDLVQIGLVTLALLGGRPLAATDFPDAVADLLAASRETSAGGDSTPLGPSLREWLSRLLCLDAVAPFRTLVEAQKVFARMVEEEPGYKAAPEAVQAFFESCESAALLPVAAEAGTPQATALPVEIDTAPVQPMGLGTPDAPGSPDTADPFGPWPVVVGSDTLETLFETYKPNVAVRESHVVSIPGSERHPGEFDARAALEAFDSHGGAPAPHTPPGSIVLDAPPAPVDQQSGWSGTMDAIEARQLRETIFEGAGTPTPAGETPAKPAAPAGGTPALEPAAPAGGTPAPEPAAPAGRAPAPSPVAGAGGTPAPLPAAAAGWAPAPQPGPSPGGTLGPLQPTGGQTTPAGGPPAASHQPSGAERRRPVVRSYDDVHRPVAAHRSRGPMWIISGLVVAAIAIAAVAWVAVPRVWTGGGAGDESTRGQGAQARGSAPGGQLGGFRITSQPPGSRISIDGKPRGVAPLRVDDLAPGLHSILVESEWGTVDEAVTVEAGKVTPLAVATVGWIRIAAPVEFHVSEEGKTYGTTGGGPVMVPAGRHHFDLVNQAVAVRLRQFVDVPPGQTVRVPVELPLGMLNLNSDQPAQVLLDGQVVGETPIVSVPAPLGSHEVIFRSEKYGDVSYTVNVTLAAPVRLTVNFNKR
jgi:hypothetical protein